MFVLSSLVQSGCQYSFLNILTRRFRLAVNARFEYNSLSFGGHANIIVHNQNGV